jgi:Tat protein secretion system quality control protein TatD with DNase activity
LTGTICKKERGLRLRGAIPNVPLERLMVETDGPFTGFKNEHRCSEPAHELNVERKLAETINVSFL